MTVDKAQPKVNDLSEQAEPEKAGKEAQECQANLSTQLAQPVAFGRKPLFRV